MYRASFGGSALIAFPAQVHMTPPPVVQFFLKELPEIGKRHEGRLAVRTSGCVSHVDIDTYFQDVDAIRTALRRVHNKNLAAMRMLADLYDEMYCHRDAYCVRKLSDLLFPRHATHRKELADVDVRVQRR